MLIKVFSGPHFSLDGGRYRVINWIGAYIVTLLLGALWIERKQVLPFVDRLERTPGWARVALAGGLVAVALQQTGLLPRCPLSVLSAPYTLLAGITLWIHEAGHVYFMFFGKFLCILGGTLLELLLPAVLLLWAHFGRRPVLRALSLYWLGFALLGVSIYMNDAQARRLPLLGTASSAGHDWYNLLSMTGTLTLHKTLSTFTFSIGCAVSALGLAKLIQRRSSGP